VSIDLQYIAVESPRKVGDTYSPDMLPDHKGPYFSHEKSRLVQRQIKDENGNFIAPHELGTLFSAQVSLSTYINKDHNPRFMDSKVSFRIYTLTFNSPKDRCITSMSRNSLSQSWTRVMVLHGTLPLRSSLLPCPRHLPNEPVTPQLIAPSTAFPRPKKLARLRNSLLLHLFLPSNNWPIIRYFLMYIVL
jgi:hypothetical protein